MQPVRLWQPANGNQEGGQAVDASCQVYPAHASQLSAAKHSHCLQPGQLRLGLFMFQPSVAPAALRTAGTGQERVL